MENRGSKGLALAALIVGIVGITIGFAAFTAYLTINPTASVGTTYNETAFKSVFGFDLGEGVTSKYAKTWTPSVTFTQNGTVPATAPIVTKTARILNDSPYNAYLPTSYSESSSLDVLRCTPGAGATEALVKAACNQIRATYKLPREVLAGGSATATVEITGPTVQVDGPFTVELRSVSLPYRTVAETMY